MSPSTQSLEGRPHYVVPVVMIREGTWSGSAGPVRYPAPALKASVPLWNGKPIVVYHPEMYGNSYAGEPKVFDKQKVGVIFGTALVDGKLKAEAWLDKQRLEAVDVRVANALRKGRPVEVSTGVTVLPAENCGADGITVAGFLIPDHLAILPDQRGACSLTDGAGLLVNREFQIPLDLPAMAF